MAHPTKSDHPRRLASVHRYGGDLGYTYAYFPMTVTSAAFAQIRQGENMDSGSTLMPSKSKNGRNRGQRLKKVNVLSRNANPRGREVVPMAPVGDEET
jgi:hypothetical protein